MAKIYRQKDRKKVQIDDIIVTLAPLSLENRSHAQALLIEGQKKQDVLMLSEAIYYTIRASLKEIEGVTDIDDKPYKLEFEKGGLLKKECLLDLLNMECSPKLQAVCGVIVADFASDNYKVEGVSVIKK